MLTILIIVLSLGNQEMANGQFSRLLTLPHNPIKAYLEVPDFIGLAKEHGLVAEQYTVHTEDGCTLQLHRLIKQGADKTKVVFFQHGLVESSDFFILFKNRSIALALLEEGYDLWFGNCRGNVYSSCNSTVLKNSSLQELSLYDLKASLDKVLKFTNQKSLIYICHSMGGAMINILLSLMPEYNSSIKLIINMAPAMLFSKNSSLLATIIRIFGPVLADLPLKLGFYRFLPRTALLNFIAIYICGTPILSYVCDIIISSLVTIKQLQKHDISKIFSYFPAGTPNRVGSEYFQLYISANETFRAYDWGREGNLKRYGQPSPLIYDLSKVTTKKAIFGGDRDNLVNFKDLGILRDQLPNVVHFEIIKGFRHLDYFTSTQLNELLIPKILKLIRD